MSSNKRNEELEWRHAIAVLETRVEELKVRCDEEYRRLHSRLDARVAELQGELRRLAAAVAADVPDAHAQRIAAQLDELRAKSDAAYDLLQVTLKSTGRHEPPTHRH
jgi:hypothetical protein